MNFLSTVDISYVSRGTLNNYNNKEEDIEYFTMDWRLE